MPYTAFNIPRIRIADEDTVMDQETYRRMMNERENKSDSWETRPSKYHISDIDQKTLTTYLEKAREAGRIAFTSSSPKSVMTKLALADGDVLLNAGAAIFVDSGMNELQMAKFATDRRLTFLDIQRFTGSILTLADTAVQYVIGAMDWRVEFDGSLERKEIPEIPVSAIREAVINAFAHRDIASMQAVDVSVYKSYIEIYSHGRFPEQFKPQQFIEGDLKPVRRNPLITRTLYYSRDMETFATGLKRIHNECEDAGVNVEFMDDSYGFTVRFYRHCGSEWTWAEGPNTERAYANHLDGERPDGERPDGERPDGERPDDTQLKKKSDAISARCNRILLIIRKDPTVSRARLMRELNLTERQVRGALEILQAAGIIHFNREWKGGHWVIDEKYQAPEEQK